jgi:hypothetical protein
MKVVWCAFDAVGAAVGWRVTGRERLLYRFVHGRVIFRFGVGELLAQSGAKRLFGAA